MQKILFYLICTTLALVVLTGRVEAEPIYMWQDEQGQVHLSDRPPPEGVDCHLWSGQSGFSQNGSRRPLSTFNKSQIDSETVSPDAGLFWKIVHPNQRVSHMLGTIHSDDPRVMKLPALINRELGRSERFVMEVQMGEGALLSMGARMMMLDGTNLRALLGEKDFNLAAQAMASYGMPTEALQIMKPWAVMAFISTPRPKSNQFLDLKLRQSALDQNKAVFGLETLDEQLSAFDGLSMSDQVVLLKATLRQLPDLPDYFDRLIRAYARDDLAGIARLSEEYQRRSGSRQVVNRFMKQLNDRRNDRMVQRMIPHLEAGNAFVAVGALHLIGGNGILAQLKRRGFEVTPVRR